MLKTVFSIASVSVKYVWTLFETYLNFSVISVCLSACLSVYTLPIGEIHVLINVLCYPWIQVEAGTQSVLKFQQALSGLRVWELCSPDVSAAIEFCRERIIEMPVDDYEVWFRKNFPEVTRPAVVTATDENEAAASKFDWFTNGAGHSRRPIKSAPPQLRRTVRT